MKIIKTVKCEFCEKEYKGRNGKRNLIKHIIHCQKNLNSIKYTCECGKQFNTRHQFIGHHSNCNKDIKKCEICNKNFIKKHVCSIKKIKPSKNYECYFCNKKFENGQSFGGHLTHCYLNPNSSETHKKTSNSNKGKHHSIETKEKLSATKIRFLNENPDKVPYLLNHSSKMSYPELLFKNALESSKITEWIYNYQQGIYQYDFAFIENKIDVEIDGGTHLTEKVKKIDARRDEYSRNNGWTVIRFTAKEVKENVQNCLDKLKLVLNN